MPDWKMVENSLIIDQIIGSNPSFLEWQLTDDKERVELFNYCEDELDNYAISIDVKYFVKEVRYLDKFKFLGKFEESWITKNVSITDDKTAFTFNDIIEIFIKFSDENANRNKIIINTQT